MEIRRRKRVRIGLVNQMMAWLEESQSRIWNPREPRLERLWFAMERHINGVLIIMAE